MHWRPIGQDAIANASGVASISDWEFRDIPAQGYCTAFLVAKDLVITASHCANYSDYRLKAVRFGDRRVPGGGLDKPSWYFVDSVEVWDQEYDLTILRLGRGKDQAWPGEAFHVESLQAEPISKEDKIYMIGNPGQDVEKYGECKVVKGAYQHATGKKTFGVDCDAVGGNSGSPVFSLKTNKVVGLFWGGQPDDKKVPEASEDESQHEFVVPMWEILSASSGSGFQRGKWPTDLNIATN